MSHFRSIPLVPVAGFCHSMRRSSYPFHDPALSPYISVLFESLYRGKLYKDYMAIEVAMYGEC